MPDHGDTFPTSSRLPNALFMHDKASAAQLACVAVAAEIRGAHVPESSRDRNLEEFDRACVEFR